MHHHHRSHRHTTPTTSAPWTPLVLLAVAQFMVILDVTVVNVALPSIGEALHFADGRLQWVITAYVLFTGGLMLLGGRMADLLGARRTFAAGLLTFTAASALSGLAGTASTLIAARALQGVGAAMLLPAALSLIALAYTGHQRAVALAVWGALGSAGVAAGVLLGGVITSLLTWEWIFFVNVPIGIAVGVALPHVIAADAPREDSRRGFDVLGAATVMAGLVALVYGIDGATAEGWTSARTLAPVAAGAALLAAFIAVERRARRPLVPAGTWRVRPLRAGATVMLGATGILVGAFFLNTLFLQDVLDASALQTGLAFLPLALVILGAAHLASHLLAHLGSRVVMVAGLLIAAAGALLLAGAPADAGYVRDLLPGFLALGFGIGLTFVSVSVTAMHDVGHEHAGLASGIMTTAHEIGAALGVAVLGSVALGAGEPAGIAGGYGDGFLAAAGIAAALALVAAVTVPSVRPAPGTTVSMH
jgi:EmrB/QacA subfamily drug resistance transporter